jgi:UDP-N-acetylglucosamine 2-epimerase
MRKVANPFGDGQAAQRIAQAVMARLVVPTQEPALAA